ncbi:MAG: flagellar hook-length control protein FliK [Pseudomonadales bacterium]|nr:flagellar hook-length control protein FliK [Pseudomonadales bacterium]
MPVLEALLPIVATASTRKDGGFSFAANPDPIAKKASAAPVDNGPERDLSRQEQEADKRFAKVLDERIQAGDEEEKRPAKPASEEKSDAAVGNNAGNALPPPGEVLPLQQPDAAASGALEGDAPEALPVSSSPVIDEETSDEEALTTASLLVDATDAMQTLEPVSTPSADDRPVGQTTVSPQETASDAITQAVAPEPRENIAPVPVEDVPASASPQTDSIGEPQRVMVATVKTSVDTSDETTPVPDGTSVSSPDPALIAARNSETALRQDTAVQANAVQANAGDAVATLVKQDQADKVRAWRGLSLSAQMDAAQPMARSDSNVPVTPLAHSGQLQQFAESLRLAVNQEMPTASGAERTVSSTSTAPATGTDATPWRAEAGQTALTAGAATRPGLSTTSFSQVLQGAAFGQPLGERFGNSAWGERLSQRVSMMIGQKISSAQIQLDPPELGAMTIKVSLHGDQASVSFQSPHAVVRDALEQSFPRLQEMLGQQGLQLADAQVSDQSASGQGFAQSGEGRAAASAVTDTEETSGNAQRQTVQVSAGLIDFYA